MTLYEITNDYIEKMLFLKEGIDSRTGELLENKEQEQEIQQEISKDLIEKSKNVYVVCNKYKYELENLETEIKRLQDLKKTKENALKRFKEYVAISMKQLEKNKLSTDIGNIVLKKSERVEIENQALLDNKYLKEKITVDVDKIKIKEDIKNGIKVNGAKVIENYTVNFK